MRNVARDAARCNFVMQLDVDIIPSRGLDCILRDTLVDMARRKGSACAEASKVALVMPAFEFGRDHPFRTNPCLQRPLPLANTPSELRQLWEAGTLMQFHFKHYPAGHGPTDYARWFCNSYVGADAPERGVGVAVGGDGGGGGGGGGGGRRGGESVDGAHHRTNVGAETGSQHGKVRPGDSVYRVSYAEGYEPFLVLDAREAPYFNEAFTGYGFNKVSFCKELHGEGFIFQVVGTGYLVGRAHEPSKEWERLYGSESLACLLARAEKKMLFIKNT